MQVLVISNVGLNGFLKPNKFIVDLKIFYSDFSLMHLSIMTQYDTDSDDNLLNT